MHDYSLSLTLTATSPEETGAIAAELGNLLKRGDVILLYGDLGAGKTTFSRGLIQNISPDTTEVVSPTFTLVQTYDVPTGLLYHYDLYRLETGDASTLTELGWDDSLMDGITLVEWPERLTVDYLPKHALTIRITTCPDQSRALELTGSAAWKARLENFKGIAS